LKVGYYQFDVKFARPADNLSKVAAALARAQADLMVLPELFASGYLFASREEAAALAEPFPDGKTIETLVEIAADRRMTIVAGFAEKAGDKLYNSAAVVTPAGPVACYRKAHLFNEEKLWFAPGDTPLPVIDVGLAKIGVMICFDWYFPEAARSLALKGAQIICHPSNLVLPYCPDSMPTRALENRVFTVTCNRIGSDDRGDRKLDFIGQSEIVTPKATILRRAPADEEELFITEIDPAEALDKNVTPRNHAFADRRTDLYETAPASGCE